jgi:SusD/RagB-like outer membrane lipoprotein
MAHRYSRAAVAGGSILTLAMAALILSSCSRDELLGVKTPDQITPGAAANAAGANAQRIAAMGNFSAFYAGDVAGSGVGLAVASGLLSDEMESARGGTEHIDQRAQNESLFPVTSPWSFAGQAQTQLIRGIAAVEQYVPDSPLRTRQIAELYALRGFTYILLGENYCNAVPIGDANDAAPTTEILSNQQLFERANEMFATALTTLGTQAGAPADSVRRIVAVGRGRALLDLNQPAQAATAVAAVPTGFVHNITFSASTIVNAMYDWMNATLNFAPADREGGVGLDYVSANDPRVTVRRLAGGAPEARSGQDGVNHFVQTVFTLGTSPVALASGVEARLIEAEAALRAGDAVTYLTKINEARATRAGLAPLALPATTRAQEDLLFRERAFWFWSTAHRVGDLRRLMKAPYSRGQAEVWPTGGYFKGGSFGTHVNLLPAQAEQNNPAFDDATERAACVPTTA